MQLNSDGAASMDAVDFTDPQLEFLRQGRTYEHVKNALTNDHATDYGTKQGAAHRAQVDCPDECVSSFRDAVCAGFESMWPGRSVIMAEPKLVCVALEFEPPVGRSATACVTVAVVLQVSGPRRVGRPHGAVSPP